MNQKLTIAYRFGLICFLILGWSIGPSLQSVQASPLFQSKPDSQSDSGAKSASSVQTWPGKKTESKESTRFDFEVDGRPAYVIVPKNIAPGSPWIWRARFPGFHDAADKILINRGFHIARINTDGMLGSPRAMQHWDKFYSFVTEFGLAKKCALEGVSRGGLFVYGFANRWPERVSCIYCDTPVLDIKSWPGGKGTGRGSQPTWKACLKEYGLTEQSVNDFKDIPLNRLNKIADAKIPILHIVSLSDVIVPPTENTFVLADRYRKLGGSIDVIEVKQGTEKSGGHHFTHPDPMRVADFIERHASTRAGADISNDHFVLRGSLDNCRIKFQTTGKGRVVFMGGSITTMKGWRDLTCDYLKKKFPNTEFEFIDAGISSTGSVPASFRMMRDAFGKGPVDLLFEEAAVNDLHNMRSQKEMVRGMEGILRQARRENPNLDIVVMHFVDPKHMADYKAGKTPEVITNHEKVADHYNVSTIHLAREVTDRISAGQFDWKNDFKNCHPSPMGHRVYVSTIRRFLNTAWAKPLGESSEIVKHDLPEATLDRFSFDGGRVVPLDQATKLSGFELEEKCDPRIDGVGGGVRKGYHDVPMLVGNKPGDAFTLDFKGRGFGIFVASGPDAGTIEWSVDGGEWKSKDLFTKWSRGLHIPWVFVLESELPRAQHSIEVRVGSTKNNKSKGTVCRIVNLLVND